MTVQYHERVSSFSLAIKTNMTKVMAPKRERYVMRRSNIIRLGQNNKLTNKTSSCDTDI